MSPMHWRKVQQVLSPTDVPFHPTANTNSDDLEDEDKNLVATIDFPVEPKPCKGQAQQGPNNGTKQLEELLHTVEFLRKELKEDKKGFSGMIYSYPASFALNIIKTTLFFVFLHFTIRYVMKEIKA